MSAERDEAIFKHTVETLIGEFTRQVTPDAHATYEGAIENSQLEHTVRKYFLDKLIGALGWDISTFNFDLAEEARVKAETTIFMDYLGVHPTSRAPVLIFEAKAWDKPPVAESEYFRANRVGNDKPTYADLISLALQHCKSNEDKAKCPVSQEWREWLLKLIEYVHAVKKNSNHVVQRVAISSGQWIVIFGNPDNAFLASGAPSSDAIFVFELQKYVAASDDIFQLLSKRGILGQVPPDFIRPEQIAAYVSLAAVRRVFLGLWVYRNKTGSVFDPHPQILIYPALLIERSDDAMVTVVDPNLGHDLMPFNAADVGQHIEEAGQRSRRLVGNVGLILAGLPHPSDAAEFPGFVRSPSRRNTRAVSFEQGDEARDFLKSYSPRADEFILATGAHCHFIHNTPRVADCRGHNWAACKLVGQQIGEQPVVVRSSDPASYFFSGEEHHCANRVLHGRRSNSCKVRAFETFLCCQTCTFQPVCWKGVDDLPCGTGQMWDAPATELIAPY